MRRLFLLSLAAIIGGILFLSIREFDRGTATLPERRSKEMAKPERNGIGIYIDASMSMRGFFGYSPNGGALIQRFLWSWMQTELLSVLPWSDISFAKFGDELAVPKPLVESLGKVFVFKNRKSRDEFFQDTQTRLIDQTRVETLRSHDAFVIVTDGVPSSAQVSGPDPRFIASVRENIIASGIHLWLIGVRSRFSGRIFPEVTGTAGKRAFNYDGMRPIYLWVGAPDAQVGRAIVSHIERRLRLMAASESDTDPDQVVRVAEFTAHEIPVCKLTLDGTGVSDVLIRSRDEYVEITYSRRAGEILRIPVIAQCSETEIDTRIALSLEAKTPGAHIERQNGGWLLEFKPRNITFMDLRLAARIDSEPWWIDWSTDEDSVPANAERTLFIQQIVEGLMGAPVDVSLASLKVEVN